MLYRRFFKNRRIRLVFGVYRGSSAVKFFNHLRHTSSPAPPHARISVRSWELCDSRGAKNVRCVLVFTFKIQNSCAGCVRAHLSYFALHNRYAARGEYSYFGRCAAAAMHYHPPLNIDSACAAGRQGIRCLSLSLSLSWRFVLELVNARNRAGHHLVDRARDSPR